MHSDEFGLIAAQQLLLCEDLHYGYWDKNLTVNLTNLPEAQRKHTQLLFEKIEQYLPHPNAKIIDIGCGIGNTTEKLLKAGKKVNALVPSQWMAKKAQEKTKVFETEDFGKVFCCQLQDIPINNKNHYELAFFSESYQYVKLDEGFTVLEKIIEKNGFVVIFDFFRKDGVEGKSPLGGGHSLNAFYQELEKSSFNLVIDEDHTPYLSPNLALIQEILTNRLIPFAGSLDKFLITKYPIPYKIIRFLLRKPLNKIKFKYSENRNQENFEKYKSYRLIVLQKN